MMPQKAKTNIGAIQTAVLAVFWFGRGIALGNLRYGRGSKILCSYKENRDH
jgi:preprotein translocase subunit SecG